MLCVGVALTRTGDRGEVVQPKHSRNFFPMLWAVTLFCCTVLEVTAGTAAAASGGGGLSFSISL